MQYLKFLFPCLLLCACSPKVESWHGHYVGPNPMQLAGEKSGSDLWIKGQDLRLELHLAPDGTATLRHVGQITKTHYKHTGNLIQIGSANQYEEFRIGDGVLIGAGGVQLIKQ